MLSETWMCPGRRLASAPEIIQQPCYVAAERKFQHRGKVLVDLHTQQRGYLEHLVTTSPAHTTIMTYRHCVGLDSTINLTERQQSVWATVQT